MKKALGLLLVIGVVWALFNFHFVLLDARLKVIPKTHYTLDHTFVDARGAKKIRLLMNPGLVNAGFRELLKDLPD